MADVFEKEGSPTQDATYREHLDRNWEAGNKKFAELEGKVQDTQKQYSSIFEGNQNNAEDAKKNVAILKEMQKQVAKLNLAVFGDGATAVSIDSQNDINNTKKAKGINIDYDNDKR